MEPSGTVDGGPPSGSPAIVAVGEELADAAAAEDARAFGHALAGDGGADRVQDAAGVGARGRHDRRLLGAFEGDEVDEGAAGGLSEAPLGEEGVGGRLV